MKDKNKAPVSLINKIDTNRISSLCRRVIGHIDQARQYVQRTIDTEMVKAYWLIGQEIVQEEQFGKKHSEYGKSVLKNISERLQKQYKRGFGVDTLEQARRFYIIYQGVTKSDALSRKSNLLPNLSPNLSWTHYRALIRVKRPEARQFYEIEAEKNHWSSRELERQIGSLLFDRLAKSKDKEGLMKLVHKGQEISDPEDAIKDPMVLEFLGLPESHQLTESKLEISLINNLQNFLLELGKGFAFVARQKRLTFDSNHFYADLVFYHVILKCYVIVNLKTHPLTHADLGQILLYVNYFDKEIKMENDNPTIGLVLCTQKSDAMVKYMLDEKANKIFASTYQFHLPSEKELEKEIKRELKQLKHDWKE